MENLKNFFNYVFQIINILDCYTFIIMDPVYKFFFDEFLQVYATNVIYIFR